MIDLINVKKVYDNGTVALDNINLHINDGEFLFIVGPSGAGKSSLLKLLLMEEKVTEGNIIVNGVDLKRLRKRKIPYYRRTLGVVFQDFRLFPDKDVYDNVAFALRVTGEPKENIKKKVEAMLVMVGLSDKAHSSPSELSGGEQQRVALARALINGPDIIIADEPTGNIDPKLSYDIMSLLLRIQQKWQKTVVVVTHEKNLVDYFNQRVVTIQRGKIIDDHVGKMFSSHEDYNGEPAKS